MTTTRKRIERHIETHPGVHFNELVRSTNIASGQVQYHVYRLLRSDCIVQESLYGRSHYFPPEYDEWDRRAIAMLRRETAREILVTLLAEPGARPNDVASRLDLPRSTLEYHLDQLIEQDLVDKEVESGRVRLYSTRPTSTETALEHVTPSLSETLVDRFMRLSDSLLEEF